MVTTMIAAGGGVLMSTTPAFAATTTCTGTLAGGAPTVTGNVIVPAGGNCNIQGQTVTGNVIVQPGGTLIIGGGSTIQGSVLSSGAGTNTPATNPLTGDSTPLPYSIIICNSTIRGAVSASSSTGEVMVGADEGCGGNTISGSVSLSGNKGGVDVWGNTIGGSVNAMSNSGSTNDDPGTAVEISGNKLAGSLSCSGNTSVATDHGPNTTGGAKTGQCAAL
jgi:hypothetical protein